MSVDIAEKCSNCSNYYSLVEEKHKLSAANYALEKQLLYMKETLAFLSSGELPNGIPVDHHIVAFAMSSLSQSEKIYVPR